MAVEVFLQVLTVILMAAAILYLIMLHMIRTFKADISGLPKQPAVFISILSTSVH
jgi:hypothetical protein